MREKAYQDFVSSVQSEEKASYLGSSPPSLSVYGPSPYLPATQDVYLTSSPSEIHTCVHIPLVEELQQARQ